MLAKLGVKLTIETVPSNDFFTKYVIPGNYDIAPLLVRAARRSRSRPPTGRTRTGSGRRATTSWNANLGRSGNAEIDAKPKAAMAELDPAKAVKLINEADRLVWREVNVLPLYQRPQTVAVNAGLVNVGAPRLPRPRLRGHRLQVVGPRRGRRGVGGGGVGVWGGESGASGRAGCRRHRQVIASAGARRAGRRPRICRGRSASVRPWI